jgi:hypothetical protein
MRGSLRQRRVRPRCRRPCPDHPQSAPAPVRRRHPPPALWRRQHARRGRRARQPRPPRRGRLYSSSTRGRRTSGSAGGSSSTRRASRCARSPGSATQRLSIPLRSPPARSRSTRRPRRGQRRSRPRPRRARRSRDHIPHRSPTSPARGTPRDLIDVCTLRELSCPASVSRTASPQVGGCRAWPPASACSPGRAIRDPTYPLAAQSRYRLSQGGDRGSAG